MKSAVSIQPPPPRTDVWGFATPMGISSADGDNSSIQLCVPNTLQKALDDSVSSFPSFSTKFYHFHQTEL